MSATPLDFLLSRRSVKFVQVPGPDDDELSRIFEAGMRAPDHGRLQPWRFRLIRGKAIADLAELAALPTVAEADLAEVGRLHADVVGRDEETVKARAASLGSSSGSGSGSKPDSCSNSACSAGTGAPRATTMARSSPKLRSPWSSRKSRQSSVM